MGLSNYILAGYAAFLLIILVINLLYFFQVFKYRLPGDVSISVLVIHIALVVSTMVFGTMLIFR